MRKFLLATTCLAACGLIAAPAAAQDQPAESSVSNPARSNDQARDRAAPLNDGDIVITAQRRSENLQRAAIAVSAVTGDALQAAGITRPTELTSIIPSLQVAPAAGPYNLFYLRGVGNFNANVFSDSAIAFNFAGVFVGRPSATSGSFYDLERVEVVKGPQGTLYGRNATGGAINVIPRRPELGASGGEASVEYGNYDALRLDGAVNLAFGEIGAMRVAGIHVRHDGYMNDGTDDQNDWGARFSLRLEPTSNLSLNIVADYFDQGGQGGGATPILASQGVATATAFTIEDRIGFFSPEGQAFYTSQRAGTLGRNFYAFPAGFRQFQNNNAWGMSGTLDWTSSLGTLTIIPAYRENHLDYRSYSPGFQVRETNTTDQTSLEARFATNEDNALRALVGAFYFNEDTSGPSNSYVSNWNGQYDNSLRLNTESVALFGRLTYAITPDIRLTAGGRQTWEDKSFSGQRLSFTRICLAPACPTAPPLPFGTTPPPERVTGLISFAPPLLQTVLVINQNQQDDFSRFTWRLGADWDVTPQNLLYASYETGFKSGGFYFSPASGTYQPETIEAFTVGSKNRFFDNRLQVNLELFHWRYRDQQISHLINIGGVPTFATENVGRATFSGFEIEGRFAATPTTTLTANVQYLDAEYDEFIYLQQNQAGVANPALPNGSGCPTAGFDAASGNSFIVDCSGRRPPNAPKWTANFSAQQRIPLSFGDLVIDARAKYQTEVLTGLEFLPIEYQDSYWLVDAAVTFYSPGRRFSLGTFVNNLFDVAVQSQIFPTPGTSFFSTTIRPPRTYGIRAGFHF